MGAVICSSSGNGTGFTRYRSPTTWHLGFKHVINLRHRLPFRESTSSKTTVTSEDTLRLLGQTHSLPRVFLSFQRFGVVVGRGRR